MSILQSRITCSSLSVHRLIASHVRRRKISEAGSHSASFAARLARAVHRARVSCKGCTPARSTAFRSSSASIANTRAGDDPHDIDWLVYAKTDKYYIKKFEAETNITGYLVMDLSRSMGYTYRQELTKFEYGDLPGRGAVLPDGPPAGPGAG